MALSTSKRFTTNANDADLLARAAWLHFVGGLTQGEVARRLDVSATRAHRLIVRAQAEGLVRISVDTSASDCVLLETQLMEIFGLDFCRVAMAVPETEVLPLRALSTVGGEYLMQLVVGQSHQVIGIGHGRTITGAVDAMGRVAAEGITFVSMLGGLTRSFAANPYDVIHRLARTTGADSYMLPAPMFVDSAEHKQMMMSQSGIAATMQLIGAASLTVVGIGTLDDAGRAPNAPIENGGYAIADLRRGGACAEILGQYLDADGKVMATASDDRVMAPPLESLRGREAVAIAGGSSKTAAIRASLKSGLLTGLITDEATARAIVGDDGCAVAAE
ncbi:MAG: sugar-binding transcriptional regulator [Pseudomonadota bacterium]